MASATKLADPELVLSIGPPGGDHMTRRALLAVVFIVSASMLISAFYVGGLAHRVMMTLGLVFMFVAAAVDWRLRRPQPSMLAKTIGAVAAVATIVVWVPATDPTHVDAGGEVSAVCVAVLIASSMLGVSSGSEHGD